jgi:phosphohistidine phosphatase
MKRLLLLRHAKAVPASEPLADSARPLAVRGERDARRVGERLRQNRLRPALILASPAARALHTAQLVASALDYAPGEIALENRLYLAAPATILDVIAAQKVAVEALLVVGHNPGLSELVHELLPAFDVDDLPTAAVVGLDYADPVDEWSQIAGAVATLAYYDFPKNAGAPVTRR